ncbi:ATP-binding protein [Yinghuangia soli]|uniref:ATP-binding protein n=1 Tax=Yinghuangia soli TaxID=2908204 RepID=A0AA41Q880_9ACTN|nr:ATP-binding protein [Yinghuangia soli]MCF2533047.1 ATP-binding protein [Yinghuangia soli]
MSEHHAHGEQRTIRRSGGVVGETAPLRQHGETRSEAAEPLHPQTHPPAPPPTAPGGRPQTVPRQQPGHTTVVLSLHLPATVEAVPRARHALRGSVRADIAAEPLDTLELLVSELVTNAVQHAPQTSTVTVELLRTGRTLRIAVTDAGALLPRPRTPVQSADEHGRGLMLVEALAEDWGSRPVPGGKVVWCDVDVLTA